MKDIRIIVAGGRDFQDYPLLEHELDIIIGGMPWNNMTIISGTAKGADQLGEKYAEERKLNVRRFPANWNTYGKAAGPIRNAQMAKYASEGAKGILVAFWDGKSKGTKNMIQEARNKDLIVKIVEYRRIQ